MRKKKNFIITNTAHITYILNKPHTHEKYKLHTSTTFKKEKILLSCLFNNYTSNPTHTILHKKKILPTRITKPWRETLLSTEQKHIINKQSTLWLGKTHDINRLYPWTKIQENITKQTLLHIRNKITPDKKLRFTTQPICLQRQWTMYPQNKQQIHYRLLFKTRNKQNYTTNKQYNLKHLSNNNNIKKLMNTIYGKHKTTNLHNKNYIKEIYKKNTKKAITITEYSKQKISTKIGTNLKERLDARTTIYPSKKKRGKNKTGYQKNERLPTHTHQHDNFKICNLIIKNNLINKIHIQEHRKLNHTQPNYITY